MAIWGVAQGSSRSLVRSYYVTLLQAGNPWDGPSAQKTVSKAVAQSKVNYTWPQTLTRPEFYLLYIMFLFVCTGVS